MFNIVDLFAGPGGLGEGFASLEVKGRRPFRIGISVEKELSAHRTLTLRSFIREYRARHGKLPKPYLEFHAGEIAEPDWSTVDGSAWKVAVQEALCLELGRDPATEIMNSSIRRARKVQGDTVLIGGPPCQAYSLVGRARSRGKVDYVPKDDERHFLFREYIRVLDRLRPAAFVMENVKGMLSSTVESRLVFEMLMEDLSSVGSRRGHLYELRAIRVEDGQAMLRAPEQPSDFVVRAEEFGVPQRRHRVIIVGLRKDVARGADTASITVPRDQVTVTDAIGNLPRLRSGLSSKDDPMAWQGAVAEAAKRLSALDAAGKSRHLQEAFARLAGEYMRGSPLPRSATELPHRYGKSKSLLLQWLEKSELKAIAQHESRGHMRSDLDRYLFASVFAQLSAYSPKASEFPVQLAPDHRNWHSGIFADRFRVQLATEPSTTVTSHISKDGHYFIHPDPMQVRSLTVREAARLQTFPDDYLFLGNRTQQYVQVGNAVPPLLARQLAALVVQAIGI
nr:DNA cytosine methyltransferase [Aestuariivirga litoralis]